MHFRILGPLEVHGAAGPLRLGGAKQRAVLAILLLHVDEVVSSDRLIDLLWGERQPPTAVTALQGHISALRKLLEPERARHDADRVLVTQPPGYRLRLQPDQLDVTRFQALHAEGRRALAAGDPATARTKLTAALALWRGPPLADLSYEPFAQSEIARLEELRLTALEERIEAELALGHHTGALPELERLTREHILRERLRAQHMLALYRAGRQAEALDVYRDTRHALVDQLGIEPTPELQQLHQAVLNQDPSLQLPVQAPLRALRRADAPSSAFVGREPQLARLRAALDDACAGCGGIALLSGEPGIGKSRLADELIADASARGARILVGRCWEAGGAPAYWPWVQALRAYLHEVDARTPASVLEAGTAELAQILPELAEASPAHAIPEAPGSPDARFRLFEAATSLLLAAARDRPVVVVLDDLHAADEPSLLLLRFVARHVAGSRLLLVGAYRDVDPTLREPLSAALAELLREPHVAHVPLDGLAEPDVARYIELSTGVEAPPQLVQAIHDETDGNALFVAQLVRLLEAEGRIGEPGAHLSIPPGVRMVIVRRLARLSERCRRFLLKASVIGREFDLEVLGRVADVRRDQLLETLDEAMGERVLTEVPAAPGRLRFGHALIRDTLYESLTPVRRMQLHREVAEALEAVHANDPEPHLSELARHYVAAAPTGVADMAIAYARRAGDRASEQLAYEEAARHYGMALELCRDHIERCRLLLALGDAHGRAGDAPASKEAFAEAAELAERSELPELLARAALGYGGRFSWARASTDPRLVPLLERALAAVGDADTPERVRLLARLAAARRDDPSKEARIALAEQAVRVATRLEDSRALAHALDGYWMAVEGPDNAEELTRLGDRLLALAEDIGDKELLFAAHDHRLNTVWSFADRARVDAELAAVEGLAEELRQPAQRWSASTGRAMLAIMEGDFERAEGIISDTLAIGRRAQSWNAVVSQRLALFVLRRAQGRLGELEETIRRSVEEYPALLRFRCALAHLYGELSREGEARASLGELLSRDLAHEHVDSEWLFSVALLPDPCAFVRDETWMAALYELLLPYEARYAQAPVEAAFGSIARGLGVLGAGLRRFDAAEGHFELALETERRMRSRPWLAHAQHDFAAMMLERGATGDGDRARDLLADALATYRELGMETWAARAARLAGAPEHSESGSVGVG